MECCFFRVKDVVLFKVVLFFILFRWKLCLIIIISGIVVRRCLLLKLGNGKNGEWYKFWMIEFENSGLIFFVCVSGYVWIVRWFDYDGGVDVSLFWEMFLKNYNLLCVVCSLFIWFVSELYFIIVWILYEEYVLMINFKDIYL